MWFNVVSSVKYYQKVFLNIFPDTWKWIVTIFGPWHTNSTRKWHFCYRKIHFWHGFSEIWPRWDQHFVNPENWLRSIFFWNLPNHIGILTRSTSGFRWSLRGFASLNWVFHSKSASWCEFQTWRYSQICPDREPFSKNDLQKIDIFRPFWSILECGSINSVNFGGFPSFSRSFSQIYFLIKKTQIWPRVRTSYPYGSELAETP